MKKISYFIISAAVSMALLSSCSSSEDISGTAKGELKTLVLSIKPVESVLPTQSSAKNATRVTNITADPTATENTINAITVGIFDKDGNVRTIQEFTGSTNPVSVTTSSVQADDKVLVAVNIPSGKFSGVLNDAQFKQKTLDIDAALATSYNGTAGAVELSNNIPMFGSLTGVTIDGSAVSAIVPVYHMVTKVSLASLKTDFLATGAYPNAIFTPTEMFLINVPDQFYLNYDDPYYTPTSPIFYQGQVSNTTKYKEYLGTGNPLTANPLSGSSTSWGTQFFYTMPNSNTTNDTRLVIAGKFQTSTSDATGTPVFYPVHINYNSADGSSPVSGQTAKQTYANYNYKLTVVIQGKGALNPTDIIDKQTATVTATVQPFVDATQTNIFN